MNTLTLINNAISKIPQDSRINNLFSRKQITDFLSLEIDTKKWKIDSKAKNIPFIKALDKYVGSIATDRNYRMTAAEHTIFTLNSLDRLSKATDKDKVKRLYSSRGTDNFNESEADKIIYLNSLYNQLSSSLEKTLWAGTILHDIGKVTGKRELHPAIGEKIFKKDKNLQQQILNILQLAINKDDVLEYLKTAIGYHDLIASIGITKERNFFSVVSNFIKKTHYENHIIVSSLINFADIDGQGPNGIWNSLKIKTFVETVKSLFKFTENQKVSNEDLLNWGQDRIITWITGDSSNWSYDYSWKLIQNYFKNKTKLSKFLLSIAKLEDFDGIYNLSSILNSPDITLHFISWVVSIAQANNTPFITLDKDNFFLTPNNPQKIKQCINLGGNLNGILKFNIVNSENKKILHFDFK